ncbi:wax ester/triacylglycerol synthase domain-containing protein [uncultured Parasphingopyxis sp.]|uniref:wax ester/triacylglycerol synthase domain-containing protein n=1 Tax=uncultured Parasphingopyxis sp. TaxID=1547918 RepID=UPI00260BD0FF|nr:wax ester/triacylglycerol synthase domain-containing protein [uncultured Parasphingopyxis sp.]
MADRLLLVPGVRRMRPDDHFMVLSETDASPMHVGALLILEVPESDKPCIAEAFRRQLSERLPGTPLLAKLVEAPDGYDSDVWVDIAAADLEAHVVREETTFADDTALHAAVAERNMERLDLSRPPFQAHVYDRLLGSRAAVYFKMHHSVADGIGFQEILRRLSDEVAPCDIRNGDAILPGGDEWKAMAERRFAEEEKVRAAQASKRKEVIERIKALPSNRAATPEFGLSGPTSDQRRYTTISLSVDAFKAVAKAHDATVNDLFLACAGGALRRYLADIGDLPEAPLVINSARSYRHPEHGPFGNRIVALHPHIATHLAEPLERLRAVQESMAVELGRTDLDEALLDAWEKPFGARDRRSAFADRLAGGTRVLPGNLTLSNVPGPATERSFAGYRQLHNFPVPIIGSGRFLNITSRRSGANLDMGVIADAGKVADVEPIAACFRDAVDEYRRAAHISD